MTATQREKNIYGSNVKIVSRSEDGVVYRIADETGEVVMTCHHVFPGIDLVYNDVHMQKSTIEKAALGNIIEINHCREGRVECQYKEQFYYLSPGDLSISRKDERIRDSFFPLKHYHGISIIIDADHTPRCLSCFLADVDVRPVALIQKFCGSSECFVMRTKPCLEHIFSELYSVPDSIKKGYFKVKILELLLFLSDMDINSDKMKQYCYSGRQVSLAKGVCSYLSAHMDRRITIDQLSEVFHVSQTLLKSSFKGVYGVSIYSYIRTQKMQAAAHMIQQTDCTILEIAGKYGYDNASKFASAFQDVIGTTPHRYRSTKRGNVYHAEQENSV